MGKYDSVEQLAQASVEALEQYKNLMSGSAIIFFLAAEQDKKDKQQEILRSIAEDLGVKPQNETSPTQIPLKENAELIYQKVQEYRQNSPEFVVKMFDEGLGFLEKLCEKYM